MAAAFLKAEWRNLIMANYPVDPDVLTPYLPSGTELDHFNGIYYVSLVGFLFTNTKVKGMAVPFHTTFEEVNLRFYVRYKQQDKWQRGVVFIKEIVPRRMITFVANNLYGENYSTHPMKHIWKGDEDTLQVEYYWKLPTEWNYIKVTATKEPLPLTAGSPEAFITEHYWGYTSINKSCTGVYEVAHPQWRIHTVLDYAIHCNAEAIYGNEFGPVLSGKPASVFLADGSEIAVMKGSRLFF